MSLADVAEAAGITPDYRDSTGILRTASPDTQHALLAAMGRDGTDMAPPRELPRWHVCTPDAAPDLSVGAWQLTLEDGRKSEGRGPLPALPMGRHRLVSGGETCWLLAAPAALPLPRRCWGLIAPLACLRTAADGGIGGFDDLAALATQIARHGAAYLGINPVHAGFLTDPGGFSPYTPSHRRRLSPLYLPTDTAASHDTQIDFAAETPLRLAALEADYAQSDLSGFDAWLARQDDSLRRFALHQALSERFGPYWNSWPRALQSPGPEAEAAHAPDRLRFHAWLQFRAETALSRAQEEAKAAGMDLGLYLDLAVGTHPFGAETWEDPDSFAKGASLGAPPDAFSKEGQNWQLAPLNPHALIDTGFEALAETLRAQLRFAGALRIDHILGFERAFWVPDGLPGAYVRMPRDAMLAVARIEAARADAVIVGEDLGNIPEGLRGALQESGILGCRVMMFERDNGVYNAPGHYPEATIASFSTHDLPTWIGWRTGRDIDARQATGTLEGDAHAAARSERSAEVGDFDAMTAATQHGAADSLSRMTSALADAGSRMVAVQVEDLLGLADQPNLPGTTHEYPNWRQRLPLGPDAIAQSPTLKDVAETMAEKSR